MVPATLHRPILPVNLACPTTGIQSRGNSIKKTEKTSATSLLGNDEGVVLTQFRHFFKLFNTCQVVFVSVSLPKPAVHFSHSFSSFNQSFTTLL